VSEKTCPLLYEWMETDKVFVLRKPVGTIGEFSVSDEGKSNLLNCLRVCRGYKLSELNMSGFFSPDAKESLSGIFNQIFYQLFEDTVQSKKKLDTISSCREALKRVGKALHFWESFRENALKLTEIDLLKPLAEDIFDKTIKEFREVNNKFLLSCISGWKSQVEFIENNFLVSLEKMMNNVAFSEKAKLETQIDFKTNDIAEAKRKIEILDSLRDNQIESSIMSAIVKDEQIKHEIDKDKEPYSELFEVAKEKFSKGGLKQFVKEIADRIITNKKACSQFIETENIKNEAEREKKRNELMNKQVAQLKEQSERERKMQEKRDTDLENLKNQMRKERADAEIQRQKEMESWKKQWIEEHESKSAPSTGDQILSAAIQFTTEAIKFAAVVLPLL